MCLRSWECKDGNVVLKAVNIMICSFYQLRAIYSPLFVFGLQMNSGRFGKVFRLSHKETGQVCAGKFYQARTSKDKTAARKEIELMKCLHHPKLVQCMGAYDTRSEIVMIME